MDTHLQAGSSLARGHLTPWSPSPLQVPHRMDMKRTNVRHPFYPDNVNTFYVSLALDTSHAETPAYTAAKNDLLTTDEDIKSHTAVAGTHHGTLAFACFILSGNKPGVLSATKVTSSGELDDLVAEALADSEDYYNNVLKEEFYYYYTVDYFTNPNYEIVSKFSEWIYPDDATLESCLVFKSWETAYEKSENTMKPPEVPQSVLSFAVKVRDDGCRLTRNLDACDAAHIVPEMEKKWWDRHGMSRFCQAGNESSDPTAVIENLISLRKDIHFVFDQAGYCFSVKYPDSLRLLHNRPLRAPKSISLPYLVTRFAWTILRFGYPKFVCVQTDNGGSSHQLGVEAEGQDDNQEKSEAQGEGAEAGPAEPPSAGAALSKPTTRSRTRAAGKRKNPPSQLETRMKKYSELGKLIERDLPPGFFNTADKGDPVPLTYWQKELVERTRYYPGCENALKLEEEYRQCHPEVYSLSNPEGPWMDVDEFDEF
ncbi:hypothetical protein TWF281_004066 [Arthrobotrys megalospora]